MLVARCGSVDLLLLELYTCTAGGPSTMQWALSSLCFSYFPRVYAIAAVIYFVFLLFLVHTGFPWHSTLFLSLSYSCLHLYPVFAHHNLWQIRIGLGNHGGSVVNTIASELKGSWNGCNLSVLSLHVVSTHFDFLPQSKIMHVMFLIVCACSFVSLRFHNRHAICSGRNYYDLPLKKVSMHEWIITLWHYCMY